MKMPETIFVPSSRRLARQWVRKSEKRSRTNGSSKLPAAWQSLVGRVVVVPQPKGKDRNMRTGTARKTTLGIVHPATNNRIETAATEYKTLGLKIHELTEARVALGARLLKMVKREGAEDEKGKTR